MADDHWQQDRFGSLVGEGNLEVGLGQTDDEQGFERAFNFRILDPVSGTALFDMRVSASDLGRMLCGGGSAKVRVTLHPGKNRGLIRQGMRLWVPREMSDAKTIERAELYREQLGSEWRLDRSDVGNHHRWGQHGGMDCVCVMFERYVPPGTPPMELPPVLAAWRAK